MSRSQLIQITLESIADWDVDIADIIEPYINKIEQERNQLKVEVEALRPYRGNHPDLIQRMAEHDAEVIQGALNSINGYMIVSQAPHSQYAKGWNQAIKDIELYQKQLSQKAQVTK